MQDSVEQTKPTNEPATPVASAELVPNEPPPQASPVAAVDVIPAATTADIISPTPGEELTAQQPEPSKEWTCPVCQEGFKFRSYLTRHFDRSHKEQAEALKAALPPSPVSRAGGRPASAPKGNATPAQPAPATEPPPELFDDITGEPGATAEPTGLAAAGLPTDHNTLAEMTFDAGVNAFARLFDDESWYPQNDKERKMVIDSIAAYYRSKGQIDLPPGVLCLLICSTYAAPRFAQPKTSNKVKAFYYWGKAKLSGLFRRFKH